MGCPSSSGLSSPVSGLWNVSAISFFLVLILSAFVLVGLSRTLFRAILRIFHYSTSGRVGSLSRRPLLSRCHDLVNTKRLYHFLVHLSLLLLAFWHSLSSALGIAGRFHRYLSLLITPYSLSLLRRQTRTKTPVVIFILNIRDTHSIEPVKRTLFRIESKGAAESYMSRLLINNKHTRQHQQIIQ